jgi:hypothetical protein
VSEIKYRVWLDNGDAYTVPRSQAEVMEDVESEMHLTSGAILVTSEYRNKAETLAAIEHLKFLVEHSDIP